MRRVNVDGPRVIVFLHVLASSSLSFSSRCLSRSIGPFPCFPITTRLMSTPPSLIPLPPFPPFSRSERSDNPVEALGIQALAFVDNHFFAAAQDQCPAAMSAHDWWTRVLGQYLVRGGELRDVEFGPTTIRSVRRHPIHNSTTFVQLLYNFTRRQSPCLLQTYFAPRFLICFLICFLVCFLICFLVSAGSAHRRGPRSAACFQPRKHGPIVRLRDGRRCGERE